jgi:hypothetical protein
MYKDYTMKEYRVKPSKAAVTSIDVAGCPRHYFHSEKLGKCRAILIRPDENLPRPKSHVDLINEEIDLFEGQGDSEIERLYRKHESLQALLPTISLDDHKRYEQTLEKIRLVRAEIIKLESL